MHKILLAARDTYDESCQWCVNWEMLDINNPPFEIEAQCAGCLATLLDADMSAIEELEMVEHVIGSGEILLCTQDCSYELLYECWFNTGTTTNMQALGLARQIMWDEIPDDVWVPVLLVHGGVFFGDAFLMRRGAYFLEEGGEVVPSRRIEMVSYGDVEEWIQAQ